jgi:NADH:ubiquinone oxidoreductase subunit E
MSVASELDDAFELIDGDKLTPEIVEELASDIGASVVHVYAAAALMTEIECDTSEPLRFELCIGGCQGWGSAELLMHLLKKRAARIDDDAASFGIVVKRCLDHCDKAAMMFVQTPDGRAAIPEASVAKLDEALAQLFA